MYSPFSHLDVPHSLKKLLYVPKTKCVILGDVVLFSFGHPAM